MDVTESVRMQQRQQVRVFYGRESPTFATVIVPFLLSCGYCAPQGSLPFAQRQRMRGRLESVHAQRDTLAQIRPHATSRT